MFSHHHRYVAVSGFVVRHRWSIQWAILGVASMALAIKWLLAP